MKKSDIFPSQYISAADLGNKEFALTIASAAMEMVGNDDEKKKKLIVRFQEAEKGLVCNVSNFDMIAFIHGDDTDGWVGKEVVLYATPVNFKGKTVMGIRIKQATERVPAGNGREMQIQDRGTHKLATMVKADDGLDEEIGF